LRFQQLPRRPVDGRYQRREQRVLQLLLDYEQQPSQLLARAAPYDRRRYLRELHSVQLRHEPGAVEAYSNLGLKVIGWGLEKVYATPYEQLVQRTILGPLDMSSSGFVLTSDHGSRMLWHGGETSATR
jgi:CubicO group peptidase (beta-lactamase class C family)